MKLTAKNIISAALVATTLLSSSPAQAQGGGITEYKLRVDSTLVLGEAASTGKLRVLNNGPASAEVRWFDPKVGAWSSQTLAVGQSLLSQRGRTLTISTGTLVCLVGEAADTKDKAGYRTTKGYFSMPPVPAPKEVKEQAKQKSKPKAQADSKGDAKKKSAPKEKPKAGQKSASKQKPKQKPAPGVGGTTNEKGKQAREAKRTASKK
ncbi:MAG: hypothetical protein OSB14_10765 [Planctomycetota bacterium]|nr:hypothetical protein [Planctomycetota bacterium]